MQFPKQAFSVGQQAVFNFQDKKLLQVVIKVIQEDLYIGVQVEGWRQEKFCLRIVTKTTSSASTIE